MKLKKMKLLVIICIVEMMILGCFKSNKLFLMTINDKQFSLLSKLKDYLKENGSYSIINQKDGENTLFYWPEQGFAVITNPHYERQSEIKKEERVTTSIIIPLKKTIRYSMSSDEEITFKCIPNIKIDGKLTYDFDVRKLKREGIEVEKVNENRYKIKNIEFVLASKIPTLMFIIVENGNAEYIEIIENKMFSYYD